MTKNFWIALSVIVAIAVIITVYFVYKFQEVPVSPLVGGIVVVQKPVIPRIATMSPLIHLDDVKLVGESVTQEISARFGALTPLLDINQDVPLWTLRWVNSMRYTLSLPAVEFVVGTISAPAAVVDVSDTFFSEELHIIHDVFMRRGFALNELNSSTSTSDMSFYDYVRAYEKGDEHCSAVVRADSSGYSKEDASIGYSIHVMCAGDITPAETEQIPLLDALDYRDKGMAVSQIRREGDFVVAGVNGIHGGEEVFFKKDGDGYRVLLKTQESPRCEIVDKEMIPESLLLKIGYDSCYKEDGTQRSFY